MRVSEFLLQSTTQIQDEEKPDICILSVHGFGCWSHRPSTMVQCPMLHILEQYRYCTMPYSYGASSKNGKGGQDDLDKAEAI